VHGPARDQLESRGGVHPRVRDHDEDARQAAAHRHQDARGEVGAPRDPLPPVEVDTEEDRLVKKANPSSENGMPMIGPANRMNSGQRSPSSNDNTVPDTAPTAKRIAVPLAQRRASSR